MGFAIIQKEEKNEKSEKKKRKKCSNKNEKKSNCTNVDEFVIVRLNLCFALFSIENQGTINQVSRIAESFF